MNLQFKFMSYFYDIKHNCMLKTEVFTTELQELAKFSKVLSHPARLAILQYLTETKTCISGDISDYLPLSRSTVSQHLKELKEIGLIRGEIDGLKINYCLCGSKISQYKQMFDMFFRDMTTIDLNCNI
jgi:ArsR family transcriptional regulator